MGSNDPPPPTWIDGSRITNPIPPPPPLLLPPDATVWALLRTKIMWLQSRGVSPTKSS